MEIRRGQDAMDRTMGSPAAGKKVLKKGFLFSLVALFILLTSIQILAWWKEREERDHLIQISRQITQGASSKSEITVRSLRFIQETVPVQENHAYFLTPLLGFMKPTPVQVLKLGGDCAGRSRLLITLLRLNGIQASKVALYDHQQVPQHAVVDVELEQGRMVVDALYGIHFPKKDGGFYSLQELQQDEAILRNRIRELIDRGYAEINPHILNYPLDQYIYSNPRTINWDKNILMRGTYKIMRFLIGPRIDQIPRPYFVESPALMTVFGVGGLQILMIGVFIFFQRPDSHFKSHQAHKESTDPSKVF